MIKRIAAIVLAMMLTSAALSGCVKAPVTPEPKASPAVSGQGALDDSPAKPAADVPKVALEAYAVQGSASAQEELSAADKQAVVSGYNEFALDMNARLLYEIDNPRPKETPGPDATPEPTPVEHPERPNFAFSPISAWYPLSALVSATKEEYKDQTLRAIGMKGLEAKLDAAAKMSLDELTQRARIAGYMANQAEAKEGEPQAPAGPSAQPSSPIKIANAIFVRQTNYVKDDFAARFRDKYYGETFLADFADPHAVIMANEWAKEKTEGNIDFIVDRFCPLTSMAIANAVYFSDNWQSQFDAASTKKGVFNAMDGKIDAQFMNDTREFAYYEEEAFQAVELRFMNGGGMVILLPGKMGAGELMQQVSGEYFDKIMREKTERLGSLSLPRFTAETNVIDLKPTLTDRGLPLFADTNMPLTGLVSDEEQYLSSIVQKVQIVVDENGAKASAVTIAAAPASAPNVNPKPFKMICDKPFAFILYGDALGGRMVLFTGIVNVPDAE